MSKRYDTVGIVLATSHGTLSDGRPSIFAQIDGTTILERAIKAHVAAWAKEDPSTPTVVVVDRKHAELVRQVEMAATYESGKVRYALADDSSDALTAAIAQIRSLNVYPENVVITMGNAGLWRPETLREVRDSHLAIQKERASVMTLAMVKWNTYPECFWRHSVLVYARPDEPLAHYLKEIREYWQYGPGRNGRVDATAGDVSANLFCVDFNWLLNCANRHSTQYQSQNMTPEYFLHRLVSVLYQQEQRQPASIFCLPPAQAHEALCVQSDYHLEYIKKVLQGLSSPEKTWDAGIRCAAEFAATARAMA